MFTRYHNSLRAGGLLLRNLFPGTDSDICHRLQTTPHETNYELFEPRESVRGTHVMVYGFDYAGEKDPRLVRFAKAYVGSGFRVALPHLPGLKAFTLERGDLERICDLVNFLRSRYGDPIRITAFSIGAGLSLVTIAQYELDAQVDLLLLFSPCYSLPELWNSMSSKVIPTPKNDREWDHFLFSQMALAYRNINSLDFTEEERKEFLCLLDNYCNDTLLSDKREFYDRVLAGKQVPDLCDLSADEDTLEMFSPAGKLKGLSTRVLIMHDPDDLSSPPEQSRQIMAELCQRRASKGERLLVTPLLSHVRPRLAPKVLDLVKILDMMGELFT